MPRVGRSGEPVADLTALGWTIMSPGREGDYNNMFFAKKSVGDFEKLCSLDVLGIEDKPEQDIVLQDFKDQLNRNQEGWYETGLLWKKEVPELANNEQGSKARLKKLVQRLERQPQLYDKYEEILREQEHEGIIERVSDQKVNGKTKSFYLPHRAVIRESAETTKVRIVFDASSRANDNSPSLNECLETGPPLQNQIWDILTRSRVKPVFLTADMKQAFLQIRIKEQERDVFRFHWIKERNIDKLEVFRFTRVLFGCTQSPFLLFATVLKHLEEYEEEYKEEVAEIKKSIYVDDLQLTGNTVAEVQHLKESAVKIFNDAKFQLHKLHSNRKELEREDDKQKDEEQSFAKQQLGVKENDTKLLGLSWNKEHDTIHISTKLENETELTKRGILKKLASVYDPLGLISPITLVGKIIFRDTCLKNLKWDEEIPESLKQTLG